MFASGGMNKYICLVLCLGSACHIVGTQLALGWLEEGMQSQKERGAQSSDGMCWKRHLAPHGPHMGLVSAAAHCLSPCTCSLAGMGVGGKSGDLCT